METSKKRTWVIGHRNPDTDSIVSSLAYAALKRALGLANCRAARAGNVNPQTEYILDRFGVEPPELVSDLIPRVEYYLRDDPKLLDASTPLWEALEAMIGGQVSAIPLVDGSGNYLSCLHYSAFARNILKKVNPRQKAIILTSLDHIIATSKAQPILAFGSAALFKARIVVAALETASFKAHLLSESPDNAIVLVGDREDVQRIAIEAGVRALVITNDNLPSRELKELAEERKVSILVSSYDTTSTSTLILYSTPVSTMADAEVKPARSGEYLRSIRSRLASAPSRSLPVVDDEGKAVGIISEGDLVSEPRIDVILVDHNELAQAVEGIEHYRIQEVIDHHRLSTFSTSYPITFINRPVGSTSTIVASMYREQRVPLAKDMASILLCGILSDTLVLRSATTTGSDREQAEYLANVADLDVAGLGQDILASAAKAGRMPVADIVRLDMKEYSSGGRTFSVSQVEISGPEGMESKSEAILGELKSLRSGGKSLFAALMVTDVIELSSTLYVDADRDFLGMIAYPRLAQGVYELKGVLSRKKQLMPELFDLVEKLSGK